jgi:iron complex transport system ATP-binding protein
MSAAIEARGVRFAYSPKRQLLDSIDLVAPVGEVVCLLGMNGTGKSTLLRCLLGIERPQAGEVLLGGCPVSRMGERERARQVAYVPQHGVTGFPYTVTDIVVMGRTPHLSRFATPSGDDRRLALEGLEQVGIAHLRHEPFNLVSGGERQLALIARALVQDAPTLVLDEPTASLDFGNQLRILEVVRQLAAAGRSVLMTTHTPDHVFLCANQAALLLEGRIVAQGRPADVLTSESLSHLYGIGVRVASVSTGGHDRHRVCVPTGSGRPSPFPRDQQHPRGVNEVAFP